MFFWATGTLESRSLNLREFTTSKIRTFLGNGPSHFRDHVLDAKGMSAEGCQKFSIIHMLELSVHV